MVAAQEVQARKDTAILGVAVVVLRDTLVMVALVVVVLEQQYQPLEVVAVAAAVVQGNITNPTSNTAGEVVVAV